MIEGKNIECYTYHLKYLEDKITALTTDLSKLTADSSEKKVAVKDIKVNDRVILFPIWGNQDTYQVSSFLVRINILSTLLFSGVFSG